MWVLWPFALREVPPGVWNRLESVMILDSWRQGTWWIVWPPASSESVLASPLRMRSSPTRLSSTARGEISICPGKGTAFVSGFPALSFSRCPASPGPRTRLRTPASSSFTATPTTCRGSGRSSVRPWPQLDLRPHGRTLVKPNLVAAGELFPHAYTRPEFVEGVLRALRDRETTATPMTELAVGERCGITIPTRFAFGESGYDPMLRAHRREALLLRGGAAGRDPAHARRAAARLPVHARAGRQGRLLRQLPQVQGAPVDDGDVLDEELHRDPGRSPSPDRSRPHAEREDRRPPVHRSSRSSSPSTRSSPARAACSRRSRAT